MHQHHGHLHPNDEDQKNLLIVILHCIVGAAGHLNMSAGREDIEWIILDTHLSVGHHHHHHHHCYCTVCHHHRHIVLADSVTSSASQWLVVVFIVPIEIKERGTHFTLPQVLLIWGEVSWAPQAVTIAMTGRSPSLRSEKRKRRRKKTFLCVHIYCLWKFWLDKLIANANIALWRTPPKIFFALFKLRACSQSEPSKVFKVQRGASKVLAGISHQRPELADNSTWSMGVSGTLGCVSPTVPTWLKLTTMNYSSAPLQKYGSAPSTKV